MAEEKLSKMQKTKRRFPRVEINEDSDEIDNMIFTFKIHEIAKSEAWEYQHEIQHIIFDGLIMTNNRIQRSAAVWEWAMKEVAHQDNIHRLRSNEQEEAYLELVYHLQNFCFRVHAYRDKLLKFVVLSLKLKYYEKNYGAKLLNELLNDDTIKKIGINKILLKFKQPPLQIILEKRKDLSHNIFYNKTGKGCFGLRDSNLADIEVRRTISQWRKKVLPEVKNADRALKQVLNMNKSLVQKLVVFYRIQRGRRSVI